MVWSLDLASLCSDKWTQLVICHQQVVAFFKQLKVSSWVCTAPFANLQSLWKLQLACRYGLAVTCFLSFLLIVVV